MCFKLYLDPPLLHFHQEAFQNLPWVLSNRGPGGMGGVTSNSCSVFCFPCRCPLHSHLGLSALCEPHPCCLPSAPPAPAQLHPNFLPPADEPIPQPSLHSGRLTWYLLQHVGSVCNCTCASLETRQLLIPDALSWPPAHKRSDIDREDA